MATSTNNSANHTVHVVEPGFNSKGVKTPAQALTEPVDMKIFDKVLQKTLKNEGTFTLVLGPGFSKDQPELAGMHQKANCIGLSSIEQLRFLQSHGLTQIVMGRQHPTLIQNARALGIDVVVGG
jgi:hypothetical protein